MTRLLLVLVFSPFLSAWAAPEAPSCHPMEEDSALFQQRTAREFFAARALPGACAEKYRSAKVAFIAARAALVKLVFDKAPADQVDQQEAQQENLRQTYLDAMAECGPCAINPIGEPIEVLTPGKTQIWYKSDGSCQLPSTDRTELSRLFDRLTGALTHLHQFPRQPGTGQGFNSIMQLSAYDPHDGHLLPDVDGIDGSGSSLFLAVKGPHETGFSYYFNDAFQIFDKGGLRQFTRRGVAVPPEGFKPPRVLAYTTASGKTKHVLNSSLSPGSSTTWYLNEDGYIRYCGTADFGIKSEFVKDFGREQLLDLLSTVMEKAGL